MTLLLQVEHRMCIHYDDFVQQSWMELRVEPRTSPSQLVHSFYLAVGPAAQVAHYLDWNANIVHHFGVPDFHDRIEVLARSIVETRPPPVNLDALSAPPGSPGPLLDFTLFGGPIERSDALRALERDLPVPVTAPLGEQIAAIGALLRERFRYESGITDVHSTSDHILEHGSGVCQDFAHLMLALLRLRAIPCRYVSGYLHVTPTDDEPSQSHAWVEVFSDDAGWVGFDPTHDRIPGEQYVDVARGRHYDDVPPNKGIYRGGASERLEVEVHTEPTTRPDVAALHAEIGMLDVPVYREAPTAAAQRDAEERETSGQQQQQQQ